jgi:hypothetical protein
VPKNQTLIVSPLDLNLWEENPRFIEPPSDVTQASVRQHLLETAKVVELAQMIVDYGGVMPGERAVVTSHEGGHLVLEGNRRVCAFQLLLDPTLIPNSFKNTFPHAPKSILDDLQSIEVDTIASIDSAVSFLVARHITSVERWPPIAKQQFVARVHRQYPTLKALAKKLHMDVRDIKNDLQDYYPLEYALNLPGWTAEEKAKLDWTIIKVDKFQRILRLKEARNQLGISFSTDLKMEISLPKDVFDQAMRLIAEAAFITNTVDTRTGSLCEVPGLQPLLESHKQAAPTKDSGKQTTPMASLGIDYHAPKPQESQKPDPPLPLQSRVTTQSSPIPSQPSPPSPNERPPAFFEHLSLSIASSDPNGTGILALAAELKDINYKKCPIASAMLMRAIIEQAMRYRIKKSGDWQQLMSSLRKKKDPGISDLISYIQNNASRVLPDTSAQRNLKTLLGTPGIKDYFDLIIHQTDMTRATLDAIQTIAKSGFVRLIEQLTH